MVEEKKIPRGYKKTEAGVIPEEWGLKRIGDIAQINMGQSPDSRFYNVNRKGLPLIQGNADIIRRKAAVRVYTSSITKVAMDGDILMTVRAPVGYIAKTLFKCCIGRGICAISYKNDYLYHYLIFIENSWATTSTGSTFDSITKNNLNNALVKLPESNKEQMEIAEVLSDVDDLINSIENLIEKKQKIKQGAMQELLTGKKRLPGFSGAWETRKIEEMAKIVNGGTPSTLKKEYWGGEINFCTPTDITSCSNKYLFKTEKTITPEGLDNCSATLLPEGTLLLCSRATIGEVRIAGTVIATNQGFKSLVCENLVYNEFLYYYIQQLKGLFISMASGSTFLEISKKDLANIDIFLPPLAEQQAIAQILSDMDSEIETLEEKLKKYQALKQGLMQELLTGRIRLL